MSSERIKRRTGRQGDGATGRRGGALLVSLFSRLPISLSPRLLGCFVLLLPTSLSPGRLVASSPRLLVSLFSRPPTSLSPRRPVASSPRRLVSLSPCLLVIGFPPSG